MINYQKLPKLTPEETIKKLNSSSGEELCLLLLSLSELDDWLWVQNTYLTFIGHNDKWVASAAITGLGHLARNCGNLEKEKVLTILKNTLTKRPELQGKIEDAISDIDIFIT